MAAAALALAAARRGSGGGSSGAAACLRAAWSSHGAPGLLSAAGTAAAGTRSAGTATWPPLQQLSGQLQAMSGQLWQQPGRRQQQLNSSCMAATPLCLRHYSSQSANSAKTELDQQQQQQQQQASLPGAPPPPGTRGHTLPAVAALQAVGWSRREVLNVPNALSMLRLLSGPLIASWIMDAQWSLALPALVLSGATDWADGYAARRFNQHSVIGSYLDPLADKVLICCVVGALGWSGVLSGPVVGIIVGRDVVLVGGIFAARAKSLGWRWPGAAEFFRISGAPAGGGSGGGGVGPASGGATAAPQQEQQERQQGAAAGEAGASSGGGAAAAGALTAGATTNPAPLVKPLFVSKVNTVFQLGLVGTCMLNAWLGWPGEDAVMAGSVLTAGTTLWTCAAYLQAYRQGRVLAPSGGASAASGVPH